MWAPFSCPASLVCLAQAAPAKRILQKCLSSLSIQFWVSMKVKDCLSQGHLIPVLMWVNSGLWRLQFMEDAAVLVRLCSSWRGKGEEIHWRPEALHKKALNSSFLQIKSPCASHSWQWKMPATTSFFLYFKLWTLLTYSVFDAMLAAWVG